MSVTYTVHEIHETKSPGKYRFKFTTIGDDPDDSETLTGCLFGIDDRTGNYFAHPPLDRFKTVVWSKGRERVVLAALESGGYLKKLVKVEEPLKWAKVKLTKKNKKSVID